MHTFAFIHEHTKELSLPLQLYMPSLHQKSGSTVGPLLSRTLGMNSVDIGVPLLSMHSSRELIHTQDQEQLTTLLTHLLSL